MVEIKMNSNNEKNGGGTMCRVFQTKDTKVYGKKDTFAKGKKNVA